MGGDHPVSRRLNPRCRHVEGLFPRDTWLDALTDVGFRPSVQTHRFSDVETVTTAFLGVRPD